MWHTISHLLLAPSKYRRTTLSVMSLAAFTLLGIEQVQAQSGHAPADQAAFDNLVVGGYAQATSDPPTRLTFQSAGRYRLTDGLVEFVGNYQYANTSANTGTLTLTYDLFANDPNRARIVYQLTFASRTTGRYLAILEIDRVVTDTEMDSFTLTVTAPDLTVRLAFTGHNSLRPGASFQISFAVRNLGNRASAGTTLRYYRSADRTISTADTQIGTDSVAGLVMSGTSAESISLTAPTTVGTYYYGACVDSVAGETNTADNCSSAARVIVTASDLVVQSPAVNDNTLTPGQSFTLLATVRNLGTETAASTTLRYYRSTDGTISTADTQIGTDSVVGLGVSGTSAESINLTAPATTGTYYYGACVTSVTGESNTENNCSAAVRVLVISANINGDGTIGRDDALVLFYAYSLNRSQVMESNLLSEALRSGMTANQVLDNANLWKNRGREMGGDLNGDGEINQQDALIMFYAYQFRALLQNSAVLRRVLFNGLRGEPQQDQLMPDTDATYQEFIRRALRLR